MIQSGIGILVKIIIKQFYIIVNNEMSKYTMINKTYCLTFVFKSLSSLNFVMTNKK